MGGGLSGERRGGRDGVRAFNRPRAGSGTPDDPYTFEDAVKDDTAGRRRYRTDESIFSDSDTHNHQSGVGSSRKAKQVFNKDQR
jgi:hypothetical protein